MKPTRFRFAVVVGCCCLVQLAGGQEGLSDLPQELAQLSDAEFAEQALEVRERPELSFEAREAIEQSAASRLGNYDFMQVETSSYATLHGLHRLAGGAIDSAVQKRLREALSKRVDNWADRPYGEVRAKIALMLRVKNLHFKAYENAQQWLAAGGSLEKIQESEQGQEDMKHALAPAAVKLIAGGSQVVYGNFSVVWEGRVTAPQTGAYTFSISPINTNAIHGDYHVQ